MPGADAPAAKSMRKCATVTPETPGIPAQWFTAYSVISPAITVPPSLAGMTASLTPASRCQNHTTWPYAPATPVSRAATSTAPRPDVP